MLLPPLERGLQQGRRADDVRADELPRTVDRTIHMRFRGQMENRIGLELGKRLVHRLLIADVGDEEVERLRG